MWERIVIWFSVVAALVALKWLLGMTNDFNLQFTGGYAAGFFAGYIILPFAQKQSTRTE